MFDRMIHALWTFSSRFVSSGDSARIAWADANETPAAQRDHARVKVG
jgi:hypothetical protein